MKSRDVPGKYLVTSGAISECSPHKMTSQRGADTAEDQQSTRAPLTKHKLLGTRIGGLCYGKPDKRQCGSECIPRSELCNGKCGYEQCVDKARANS